MKLDTLQHKWLRVPYLLRVNYERRIKRPHATLLFLHGIGASSKAWDKVVARLPHNVNVATIDLLGFGLSPRPAWAVYDAKRQARSVVRTCRKHRIKGPVIIVGHSMGALVAVEVAKTFPRFVASLILCSPPFYAASSSSRTVASSQKILTSLYTAIRSHPEQFVKISRIAAKYKIINHGFQVDDVNVHAYMNALEACIVNQTAYDDIQRIAKPITVTYGTLDPVVITKNLKLLAKNMSNVTLKSVVAGHEIKGPYINVVARCIENILQPQDAHPTK